MKKILTYYLIILWTAPVLAQLSPGKLSAAHSKLEGISNCTQCHVLGKQITNQKCLDCHKEIQSLISQDQGYHASKEVNGKSCAECHSEHHGPTFDATRFDEEKFDHTLTGYKLEGQHASIECRDCHKPGNIADQEIKKLQNTFLGMGTECLDCHEDFHQQTLGTSCTDCHDQKDWRPAPGFDHNTANFVLEGAHQKVDCKECHQISQRSGREFQQFTELSFSQCIDCHEDKHEGRFGTNCLECHTANSFKLSSIPDGFDHNLTDYPLEGMHQKVECKSCHISQDYTRSLAHNTCNACHEDYHKGDFVENGKATDCKECHVITKPFDYTLFGLEEHAKGPFALEEAHIATPCFACHMSEDQWSFRDIGTSCTDCHDNIHEGKIDNKFYADNQCTACHNTAKWSEISFDHDQTDWSLEGKHEEVNCRKCHFRDETKADFGQQFASLNTTCFTCHENVHGEQFGTIGSFSCTECHSTARAWNVENFAHDKTNFPLEGQHSKVDCNACHKPSMIDGAERIEYKIQKFACIDCHS